MKKCIVLILLTFVFVACNSYSYDLEKMAEAVRSHMRYRDQDRGTITKIDYIKALSYDKIPEDKREKPNEEYLCKVYMRGTWSYPNSYRVFNIDDTIKCIFDKNKSFIRIDDVKP